MKRPMSSSKLQITKTEPNMELGRQVPRPSSNAVALYMRLSTMQRIYIQRARVPGHIRATLVKEQNADKNVVKLKLPRAFANRKLDSCKILLVGKRTPTMAVAERWDTIMRVLQGRSRLFESPIAKCLWLGADWKSGLMEIAEDQDQSTGSLNESQLLALSTMLYESRNEDDVFLPIIIGPPGTGKTTLISAFTRAQYALGRPLWLVAQSNVAVRNMAERLQKDGFLDWRLLVSYEFSEW
jgi:hypothetical protein